MANRPLRFHAMLSRAILVLIYLLTLLPVIGEEQISNAPMTVTIAEVTSVPYEFNKKPLRLKFHFRDKIKAIDKQRYYVLLFDKDLSSMWVEFGYEGLSAMKDLPTRETFDATKSQFIYGQAWTPTDTERPPYFFQYTTTCPMILDALGRKSLAGPSGAVQYEWE